ncbi:MAG: hypothetical protein KGI08_09230 [Thaumarchaeota archaeon]|nr:hypothetical protein [Nitrososphaerota archaeon]
MQNGTPTIKHLVALARDIDVGKIAPVQYAPGTRYDMATAHDHNGPVGVCTPPDADGPYILYVVRQGRGPNVYDLAVYTRYKDAVRAMADYVCATYDLPSNL